ncbi:MAG TPA: carbamoyltransferase HypF [Solirubrobacteraceae bacterium]|jgi:hydrogenase maturation protein HypF|nr:carbamoyltransferase HypF [Solirubrobacteraceae bacterium]
MAATASRRRIRLRVIGTVQGVGFRPFVYRLAAELALVGWVRNDERGVEVEVEGTTEAVEAFLARLPLEAPPLARVEHVRAEPRPVRGERSFLIAPSARAGEPDALVAPDAATCQECLAELLDPGDRRFRYPFINCTNCGPRFTIVRGVPYDRPLTTMAGFAMCAACRAEYEDPANRRFHAQPNACPVCGPRARLLATGAEVRDGGARLLANEVEVRDALVGAARLLATGAEVRDALAGAARLLAEGAVLAVKGLGGYHLACRAEDEAAVVTLRARKQREDRPFALMVGDLAAARRLVFLRDEEAALLQGPARPIVLAPRRTGVPVAHAVAPGAPELGLMLPYTPLHHLLLADVEALGGSALVMTSGNVCDEPIAYEDEDALARLAPLADAFLLHDRPIHMRTDDSVVRAVRVGGRRRPLPLRRSRGYVPASLRLPLGARRPLLACGAELKSTFCVARGERAWVSHHIGDLRNWETLRSFREGIAHFEELFAVAPKIVVHDLHPDYLSTAYAIDREQQEPGDREHRTGSRSPRNPAIERPGIELLAVQHHHAHLAAVLAEHGETGPAVGAIYDGAGYGTDGSVWGGELLVGGLAGFERAGHLRPVRLPGGDRAAREPWRMACAWIAEATEDRTPPIPPALSGRVDPGRWGAVARIAQEGVAAPITTSAGRLCDAVAALCGLRAEVTYEGQAAIELEAVADLDERSAYAIPWEDGQLDPRPAIAGAMSDFAAGAVPATISARFHNALAAATVHACVEIAGAAGLSRVVLAGGVFQNRLLLERVAAGVRDAGLDVLTPERLPPNDGAISYGQAAIAAAGMDGRSFG